MSIAFGRAGGTTWGPRQGCFAAGIVLLTTFAVALAGCSRSSERSASWQQQQQQQQHATINQQPVIVDRSSPLPTVAGQPPASPQVYTPSGRVPMVAGVYKVGNPYTVNGVVYVPREDHRYDRIGMASWYGKDFHARQTANGEFYDSSRLTGAHPTLPLPSYVYVTNLRNGRTVIVRLNDRGPYKHGRIVDVSQRVAQALGFETVGTTEVRVRWAGFAPLDPNDDRRERQYLAAQSWSRVARSGWGSRFGLGMGGAGGMGGGETR